MTDQAQQPVQDRGPVITLHLHLQEINFLRGTLRKFPMEQVEGLVNNITMQATAALAAAQANNTADNQGETK